VSPHRKQPAQWLDERLFVFSRSCEPQHFHNIMRTQNTDPDPDREGFIAAVKHQWNEHVTSGRPRYILRTTSGNEIEVWFDEAFHDETVRREKWAGCEWPSMEVSLHASRDPTQDELREAQAWSNQIVSEWSQRTGQRVIVPDLPDIHFVWYIDGAKITRFPE
jgi:hypothetical protein